MATLPHVVAAMFDPSGDVLGSSRAQLLDDGRDVAHALNRLVGGDLGGLFDGPSTVRFDPELPMVSLDLSRIAGSDAKIGLVMACASSWMEAALQDPSGGPALGHLRRGVAGAEATGAAGAHAEPVETQSGRWASRT